MASARTVPERINYFISHTGIDREYAEWIGWELERAGYTYNFRRKLPTGSRFMPISLKLPTDPFGVLAIKCRCG